MAKIGQYMTATKHKKAGTVSWDVSPISRFMGPTWGPSGANRNQMGPCWPHEPCHLGSRSVHDIHAIYYHLHIFPLELHTVKRMSTTDGPKHFSCPMGNWTHNLQTEATWPAAISPVRLLNAPRRLPRKTRRLQTRPKWTSVKVDIVRSILNCALALTIWFQSNNSRMNGVDQNHLCQATKIQQCAKRLYYSWDVLYGQ